jgi:GTPase
MIKAKHLNKEKDYGNKEYKLELVDINKDKIDRLITQFRFRLFEGSGLAWYYIGFSDYGIPIGLNKYKYTKTLNNILKVINYLELKVLKFIIRKGIKGYCFILKLKTINKIDLIY